MKLSSGILIVMIMISSNVIVYSQEDSSEKIPEILFVGRESKSNALFSQKLILSGSILTGVGLLSMLTTSVLSTIETSNNTMSVTEQLRYGDFNVYDMSYMVSSVVLSAGISSTLLGVTYDGRTTKQYEKWKKTQKIIGFILSGVGIGLLASGVAINISDVEFESMYLINSGLSLSIIGIPSMIIGFTGIL